uniref:FAM86 N-terminal domain-containing protein n=1 Tax=Nomascus leucogenys TaxID=61853 RepID=A0A2I3GQ89_NOMLE
MAPEENAGSELLLQSFERRFLAARALPSFPWQMRGVGTLCQSTSLLRDLTVKHPVCVKHPLSVKYARCFLSELIKKHEAVHTEPLDELYEALAETLMGQGVHAGHRSYLGSVTLSESTAIISHGTMGLVTWDAALYLAEWAIENPAAFTHRTILELGSGAGLTGLAICKLCRSRAYIFSDCHSWVLKQLQGNALLNGLSLEADITANLPDVVIAADVLYCPEAIVSLVGVLWRLHQRAPEVYVAFTVRNPETCQLFTTELGRVGIRWEAEAHHDQKLFPYKEHLEMAMLSLTL